MILAKYIQDSNQRLGILGHDNTFNAWVVWYVIWAKRKLQLLEFVMGLSGITFQVVKESLPFTGTYSLKNKRR